MPYPIAMLGAIVTRTLGQPGAITVTRKSGSYVDGVWTPGVPSTFAPIAAVHPLEPADITQLPEGARVDEAIEIYTVERLLPSDVETGGEADEVTWDGRTFVVDRVEPWGTQAGYCRAIALRMRD
jgi:hypothetical protein